MRSTEVAASVLTTVIEVARHLATKHETKRSKNGYMGKSESLIVVL